MQLRPKTWFIISLLLFVAAAFFLYLGEKRRKEVTNHGRTGQVQQAQPFSLTNPLVKLASAHAPGSAGKSDFDRSKGAAAGSVVGKTNALAYRLTNTTRAVSQLLHDDRALLLRNALYDTANPARPEIPAHLKAKGDPGSYIVQAHGRITDMFRRRVLQSGAELVSYIPNNAMLVRASEAQVSKIRSSPQVQAVLPYEPYYKLDDSLLPLAVENKLSPYGELNVVAFPNQAARVKEAITQLGGAVLKDPERTPFGDNLVVKAPASKLAALAQIPEVQIVSVHSQKRVMNDLTRVKVHVSTNTTTPPPDSHYLGLSGDNVKVVITDSGVDATHPDLTGRIEGRITDDGSGHGTHVAGTILGDGTASGTVGSPDGTNSYAQGSTNGANFSGMAPKARAFVQSFFGPPDAQLQATSYLAGAAIANNSWGYNNQDYDIYAASYDAAVRDSLPGVTGEQQMTYVFSAGNDGGSSGTIVSPATAKDVITVGASELLRRITNEVWKCKTVTNFDDTVTTTCETNRPWFGMTDSDNQVAGFSSRGNVGIGREGPNGRFKPDIIAPGAMLVSCRNNNYVDPSGTISTFVNRFNFETLDPGATNLYLLGIPPDCLGATIFWEPNTAVGNSPTGLWINAAIDTIPSGPWLGLDRVTLDQASTPPIGEGTLYFQFYNPWTNVVNFDVVVVLTFTNDVGNYWEVLAGLQTNVMPSYRYEAGTSMSAGVVSGVLALMQEFYGTHFSVTNSPALNKALLVNGARSLSRQYNIDPHSSANNQGWGLLNISNSAPAGLQAGGQQALWFYDQSPTNALSTGDSHTYTITVPPRAQSSPLRINLAWTDPAGNPVSGPKLVNDLDLYVEAEGTVFQGTNSATGTNRWIGNNFASGTDFSSPILVSATSIIITNIEDTIEQIRDNVNNVEAVYLSPPLAPTYTVVVKAHRVNVNAVNSVTNGIVQDYALVISSGTIVNSSNTAVGVTGPVLTTDPAPRVTSMQRNGLTNAIALLNQHVGANSPFITTTNGATNQWAFYTFTNMTTFTNVVIFTFLPPNLGFLHPDPDLTPRTPRYQQGDIDLYVARDGKLGAAASSLTNLDDAVIGATDRSVGRRGTEYVIYSDARPGEVYWIGVKAEDQQAATFGLYAIASLLPPSNRDESNNVVATAFPMPVDIPDGSPDAPGGTNLFVFVADPDPNLKVQRIYVTNTITHEDAGDLIGILEHFDESSSQNTLVTLNNHRYWAGTETDVYDDSQQGDLTNSVPTDGPGSLRDYVGHLASGPWIFTISDNALFHTGRVDELTIVIEPASTNDDRPVDLVRTILPGRWIYAAFDVASPDITNARICVTYESGSGPGPVDFFVRRGQFPTQTLFDKGQTNVSQPGMCMDFGLNDSPPLSLGRYFVGVHNDNTTEPVTIHLTVTLERGLNRLPPNSYEDPASTLIVDDATTNSTLVVTNKGLLAAVEVDLRLDHPRASEMAVYLIDPQNTRVLMAENRGRDIAKGYGIAGTNIVVTNFGARILDDSFEQAPPRPAGNGAYQTGTIISGWRVESGDVDVVNDPPPYGIIGPSHTGTNGIDMNGWDGGGVLLSNVTTSIGKTYLVQFAYCKHPQSVANTLAIEVAGAATNTFTYNSPNAYDALAWSNAAMVFTAVTNLSPIRFRQLNPPAGNAGMYIDTVRIDEVQIVTNSSLYATFTDDTTKLPTPIKFAPPPFGVTNFTGTNIFISGFEGTNNLGRFTNGMTVDGWLVKSNSVLVRSNVLQSYSETNHVLLRSGTISRTLTTEPGKEYRLEFATRSAGREIYDTGVDNAREPLSPEDRDPHYLIVTNTVTPLPITNALVLPTNVMGADWMGPTGFSRWIGTLKLLPNSILANASVTYRTRFDLFGYNTNAGVTVAFPMATASNLHQFIINGQTKTVLLSTLPSAYRTVNVRVVDGLNQRLNTIDFIVTNFIAGPHGFRIEDPTISGRLLPNVVPRVYTAHGQVRLLGSFTNNFLATSKAAGWNMQSLTFVAPSNSIVLEFEGQTDGVWLDHVQMRETGRKYYLPEEPFAPMLGHQAAGQWQLQLWDTRLGQVASNGMLLNWRLSLTYVRTNPPLVRFSGTNSYSYAGTVISNEVKYFMVDVPCDGASLTNTLTPGPLQVHELDLIFNQDTFPAPTGLGDGDVALFAGILSPSSYPMAVGFYPLMREGSYWLEVRNTFPTNVTDFTLQVNIDTNACVPGAAFKVKSPKLSPSGVTLAWTSDLDAEFSVYYATDPAGPWTLLKTGITSITRDFSFTDTMTPGGRRFYRVLRTK